MRQCLSQVKGGKLAEAMHPAQVSISNQNNNYNVNVL